MVKSKGRNEKNRGGDAGASSHRFLVVAGVLTILTLVICAGCGVLGWRHIQDVDARLVKAEVAIQELRDQIKGQDSGNYGGGASEFDSREQVRRRRASAKATKDRHPGRAHYRQ